MTDLLRAIAGLPQSHGGLSVSRFGDPGRGGFWLARTDGGPEVAVAMVAGDEAEGYARLLSGAPAILDLLATALLRWGRQVEADTEIDGGDAVEWLSGFTTEARGVLETMVGPLAPEEEWQKPDEGAVPQRRPPPQGQGPAARARARPCPAGRATACGRRSKTMKGECR